MQLGCVTAARTPHATFESVGDETADDVMYREMMGEMFKDMDIEEGAFDNQLFTGEEELFASERCVSRLLEMQGAVYRRSPHRPERALAALDLGCLEYAAAPGSPNGQGDADAAKGGQLDDPRPRFSKKHFWGGGWWEQVRDKLRLKRQ